MNKQPMQGWQQFLARFPTARLLWDAEAGSGTLRAYTVGGHVVLIHDYHGDNGWTAYVDPFTTLDAAATFDAIALNCGDLDAHRIPVSTWFDGHRNLAGR